MNNYGIDFSGNGILPSENDQVLFNYGDESPITHNQERHITSFPYFNNSKFVTLYKMSDDHLNYCIEVFRPNDILLEEREFRTKNNISIDNTYEFK